ncbi:MAG: hypothetical protein KC431_04165, partial [Myxococcales bacterium]|nr:hypothetical protein [Myxococcales bacterium]
PASAAEVIAGLEAILAGQRQPSAPLRPTGGVAGGQPRQVYSTAALVDSMGRSPGEVIEQHIDDAGEALSRFGRATTAWFSRLLIGLLLAPVGAVFYVGVPVWVVGLGVEIAERGGAEFADGDLTEEDVLGMVMAVAILFLLPLPVFIRSCWAHRREPGSGLGKRLWIGAGLLLLLGWVGALVLEHNPGTTLSTDVHVVLGVLVMLWLAPTLAWVAGRMSSLLLRRL